MLESILYRIDKRLAALGISESAASKKAGLSDSAIRNIRRAVKAKKDQGVSIRTLEKLAPVLKTSVIWLAQGVGLEEFDDEDSKSLLLEEVFYLAKSLDDNRLEIVRDMLKGLLGEKVSTIKIEKDDKEGNNKSSKADAIYTNTPDNLCPIEDKRKRKAVRK